MPSQQYEKIKLFRIESIELVSTIGGNNKLLYKYGIQNYKTDLISIQFTESMLTSAIEGEAIIRDFEQTVEDTQMTIGNYDILRLKIKEKEDRSGGEEKDIVIDFLVYAYSQITSESEIQFGFNNIARLVSLKLTSPEHYILNYNFFEFMEQDEILKISFNKPEQDEEEDPPGEEEEESELERSIREYETAPGMVQYLFSKIKQSRGISGSSLKVPGLTADNTLNWVWLKKNHNFYPWGKFTKPPRISQLLEMLAENAVYEENPNAANFFFWRDRDSYNFRCVEKIIDNFKQLSDENKKTYYISPLFDSANTAKQFDSGSDTEIHVSSYEETDFFDLVRSYAIGSRYAFVEPKYAEDPYSRYLDTQDGHIDQDIVYNYFDDKNRWKKIDGEPNFTRYIGDKQNRFVQNLDENTIVDKMYGYFSPNFFNRKKTVSWEYYGYERSNRNEEELWQTQFDITDMRGVELKIIQEKIKKPIEIIKKYYTERKNLKEKWRVYKCSVCCAGNIDGARIEASGPTGTIDEFKEHPGLSGFYSDDRFIKANELKNTLSNYEIVAAGSFTDTINYDFSKVGVGDTGTEQDEDGNETIVTKQTPWTISGMTLSYNLKESPYNLSLGEFFSLEKKPDNFIRYRFDLEIKRHEKLKLILENNILARQTRQQLYEGSFKGYTLTYTGRNDICLQTGCTGYCVCPTEYPEIVNLKTNLVSSAHTSLIDHEREILKQIDPMIDRLKSLKEEFSKLYDKYWSRKAFFFSRDIDFSFLKSSNNLFNIKSITRKPIMGSKYEPFAIRKALGQYPFKGTTTAPWGESGGTYIYPYDVEPSVKELDLSVPAGKAGIGTAAKNRTADKVSWDYIRIGASGDVFDGRVTSYYGRSYRQKNSSVYLQSAKIVPFSPKADFWQSFSSDYSNFPYSEANDEKAKGPIWYRNWLVFYEITVIKPPCLNRKPPCFQGDCSCDEIKLPLRMHFETFANYTGATVFSDSLEVSNYALSELSKNCDGCKVKILGAVPSSDIKLYHPWAADDLMKDLGLSFSYVDYKKASSLLKDEPGISYSNLKISSQGEESGQNIPPHVLLEGLESFVRVEFMTPIGVETLKDFPEGFIDTYGSEYFLPYIVLATAGPFGSQSARTNISVIGQDPYGFDLAVKKIKNKDDFAGMNLQFTDGKDPWKKEDESYEKNFGSTPYHPRHPFSTSSSWMKTSQNSLFYKPDDGIADLFVPNGVQDIFMASRLEKSIPAKTWWDLWVSLPPIAVTTFYNRWDVYGSSGGSLKQVLQKAKDDFPLLKVILDDVETIGKTFQGIAFYDNNSLVAEPFAWTAGWFLGLSQGFCLALGCSGISSIACDEDRPWPLYLHPDTEQIITGSFPSNVAVVKATDLLESSGSLGEFGFTSCPPEGLSASIEVGSTGFILPSDPSNYTYNFAEFPSVWRAEYTGCSNEQCKKVSISQYNKYPIISYPVGTLIWGGHFQNGTSGANSCDNILPDGVNDYNYVHRWDISRKTQYGIVQLSSDSMPSLLSLINGVGGDIEKIQEYQKWISSKLIDWFQNSIFDNNFSAQFVVMSRQKDYCEGLKCMNPGGFPGISGCKPEDPLCNCPCQGPPGNKGKLMSTYINRSQGITGMPDEIVLRPDLTDLVLDRFLGITYAVTGSYGPEPSFLELDLLEKQMNECAYIKKNLGENWLGCVWDKPESPYSCSCPCIGKNFPKYMKFNRTYSTFWDTPIATPLLRTAQMALLNSNKISITVAGDFDVRPGQIVIIKTSANSNIRKRFTGNWLVTTIKHVMNTAGHVQVMTLSREGQRGTQTETESEPPPQEE